MEAKSILIVEDEVNLAQTLSRAIRLGMNEIKTIKLAETGEEALALLEKNNFDIVLTDFRLPGISGLDVIGHIAQKTSKTRFILMTGYGSDEVEAAAKRVANAYLTKPFDMVDLIALLQTMLHDQRIQDFDPAVDNGKASPQAPFSEFVNILIMEDDMGLQRIYSKALGKGEYVLKQASNLQEARNHLDQGVYQILICDIHLGRERGTDILEEYKDKLAQDNTQIIMASAYGGYRQIATEMGAEFFLEKPISLSTLITLVERIASTIKSQVAS